MVQSDEELARLLQDQEYSAVQGSSPSTTIDISAGSDFTDDSLALQTDTPFKDLHGLFLAFNDLYFESKLSACEVRWSPRMTVCAGLCIYQSTAQYCSIRLSEPLLKFRPESDYIDTLLHEMIHAYLFVTQAIQDHDGHGADFQYHMNRINKAAGTTITIYHTFHDEVRYYKTHVWKCNGPCQHRPPYYGIVRRSMNRPPQPADRWYAEHQESCGGTYTKISEPDPTLKKKSAKKGTTSTESTTPIKEDKSKPRSKTMLDNFLIPPSKIESTSPKSESPLPSSYSSSSSISNLETKLKYNHLQDELSVLDQVAIEVSIKSSDTIHHHHKLSPREAAAAAALARYERHLASRNQTNVLSSPPSVQSPKPTTSTPTPTALTIVAGGMKRKKVDRTIVSESEDDDDGNDNTTYWKKLKDEDFEDNILLVPTTLPSISGNRTDSGNRDEKEQPAVCPTNTQSELNKKTLVAMVVCPVCSEQVEEATINDHVDLCIWRMNGGES
ncbi:hypothetical protein FBU30_010128 [Linnemannia zychae]|nr:hypothetical protein FBU30_010128 [Linnemannia zychae]